MSQSIPPPLSPGQLEVMQVVWDHGEVTVGEVHEILAAQREIARNTVQTTLVRLHEKGWLTQRRVTNANRYKAAVPRRRTLGRMVRELVDSAFGGSADGLMLALLEDRGLSHAEAERISQMIQESEHKSSGAQEK